MMKVCSSIFSKYKKGVKDVAKTELNFKTNKKLKTKENSSLNGTLVSVFLLGFFLIISWVGVFLLFLERQ
jgi:hypothetical protein